MVQRIKLYYPTTNTVSLNSVSVPWKNRTFWLSNAFRHNKLGVVLLGFVGCACAHLVLYNNGVRKWHYGYKQGDYPGRHTVRTASWSYNDCKQNYLVCRCGPKH